jgi:Ca2+-binding RTX toxin-like protein
MHRIRSVVLGLALAGAAIGLVPAAASAAPKQPTCTYTDGTRQVNLFDKSDAVYLHIVRDGDLIAARNSENSANTTLVHCFSTTGSGLKATVNNTDKIVVSGTPVNTSSGGCPVGCPKPTINDGYLIDTSGGPFAPGATLETDGNSEIEMIFETGGIASQLEVRGSNSTDPARADAIRVGGPLGFLNFGYDDDTDVKVRAGAAEVTIDAGAGADFVTGTGNSTQNLPTTTVPLLLLGGSGKDFLFGGNARDTIFGGTEDDYIQTPDDVRDVVDGGPQLDAAITDVLDTVTSLESNVVMPIGTLELSPRTLRARAGRPTRLNLSWTHPMAWRELRSVELQLYDGGNERVGSVMARAAGLKARGAVKLLRRSRVGHHGKAVTARLAMRLPRSLAGEHLRVAVEATDRLGHRQVEPDAGVIRVR